MVDGAEDGNIEAVRLMLQLGFPVNARAGDHGCTPLHAASGSGSAELVRLLLDNGADLEALDTTWSSTPLVWAMVGSGMRRDGDSDFVSTVRILIEAGAQTENGCTVDTKPPSAEVAALLQSYGIGVEGVA